MGALKHAGLPLVLGRLGLAVYVVMSRNNAEDMGALGYVLIASYALGLFTVCGIRAESGNSTCNGR